MPTTPNGLVYPALSDAPNGPGAVQALAESIEAKYPLGPWTAYTPALTASGTNPTLGTAAVQLGRYRESSGLVLCQGKIVFGSAGVAAGAGNYRVGLPVPANIAAWADRRIGHATIYQVSSGNQAEPFATLDAAGGGFFTLAYLTALPASNAIPVGAAAPWAWAVGDTLWWNVAYEPA